MTSGWEVRREAMLQGTLDAVPEPVVRTATGIINPDNARETAVLPWEPNSREPSALHAEIQSLLRDGQKATKCCSDPLAKRCRGEMPR